MPRKLVNMRLPDGLLARADAEAERLGQTRTKFVERALESALGGVEESEHSPLDHSVSTPVRAPVLTEDLDAFAAGEVDHSADVPDRNHPLRVARVAGNDLMMQRQERLNKRGKK